MPRSGFVKSVTVLAGGTAAAQAIVVASSPLLTRLYSPEDFGMLAVYGGLLGILGVIASLRYQLAIPLPDANSDAANITVLSLLIVLLMAGLIAVFFGVFGADLVEVLNINGLEPYIWLIPVGLLLLGVYQVLQYWAIRRQAFGAIAKTSMSQSLGMVLVQIAGYALGPIMLLLGRIVGQSAGIFSLSRLAFKGRRQDFSTVSWLEIKKVAVRYRNFPMISSWTGLASSAGANLPPLLIAAILGAGPAGLFSLAHRVLSQPMAVIGQAINDAFYQKAAQAHRDGNLNEVVEGVYSVLVLLALPLAITGFIVVPDLFVIIFGAEWANAGEIARWMIPWLFFQFVVSPCTGIYPVIDRHDIALRFQLSLLLSSVTGIMLGGVLLESLVWVVIVTSLFSSLVYIWRLITTFTVLGGRAGRPVVAFLKLVPVSVIINAPLALLFFSDDPQHKIWIMIAAIVLVLGLWYMFCARVGFKGIAF